MPRFEVHIPAVDTAGFNFTFRVDAETWMAALKTGMQKLGEQGAYGHNVLVDIQDDNSLHVTESSSGRVFQIRELSEQEAASAPVKRSASRPATVRQEPRHPGEQPPTVRMDAAKTIEEMPAVSVPLERPREQPSRSAGGERGLSVPPGGRPSAAAGAWPKPPVPAPTAPSAPPPPQRTTSSRTAQAVADTVVELERPIRPVGAIGRAPQRRSTQEEIESVLAEVFERVQGAHAKRSVEEALYFLLDLSLEKIPAESGTLFRADAATGDLQFAAVRGPKAQELLRANLVVPAGTGIVGFCAMEGVSVALSDVQKDPRYFAAVAARLGYETRSVLCSPMMTHGRTFGCLQLINKQGTPLFTELEVGIAAYIAHQAALFLSLRG